MDDTDAIPPLRDALRAAGYADAGRVARFLTRDLPADGGAIPGLAMVRDDMGHTGGCTHLLRGAGVSKDLRRVARTVATVAALAPWPRFDVLAFADAVIVLAHGANGTKASAVGGALAAGVADLGALAALSGDRWVEGRGTLATDPAEALSGERTALFRTRAADAMASWPGEGINGAWVRLPSPDEAADVFPGPGRPHCASIKWTKKVVLRAAELHGAVARTDHRGELHPGLDCGWNKMPIDFKVPNPVAASAASLAAAAAAPARARTLAWLDADPGSAGIAAGLRIAWGGDRRGG